MGATRREVVVREARIDDAGGLVAVLAPIVEARIYSAIDTVPTEASQRAFFEAFPSRGIFHVAEERPSGRLVGMQDLVPFAEATPACAHGGDIATFVALDHHRRGIAARLFAATYEAAVRKGYEKILAWVRADNEAGLRAYRGQGFRDVGIAERHAKIDGRYVDEVILERLL